MRGAIREPIAGRYRLGEKLGGGGMAEVYDAIDLRLDRPVALKLLRDGLLKTPGMVQRAEAEARMAAKIHHPNVVAVLDAGRAGDTPFVVMERLPGPTLGDRLKDAPLGDDEVREVGLQILSGLSAAHDLGVVHRDIKPSNVLTGPGGEWKLADFGIATLLAGETTLTATGEIIGSVPYLAPERIDGQAATPASDLFSVGVLLYEAATGHRPVQREDPLATVAAIRNGEAEPLSTSRPDIDAGIRDAIERALEVDPATRWQSAEAFAEALRASRRADGTTADGTTQVLRLPNADAPATEPLPSVSSTAVLSSPGERTSKASMRAPTPIPTPTSAPTGRTTLRRRAMPRRALHVVVGAALALVVVLALATIVFSQIDPDTSPPASPTLDASVPRELRSSLDELREAIAP